MRVGKNNCDWGDLSGLGVQTALLRDDSDGCGEEEAEAEAAVISAARSCSILGGHPLVFLGKKYIALIHSGIPDAFLLTHDLWATPSPLGA